MGFTGIKQWEHKTYDGMASAESPNVGDSLDVSTAEIGRLEGGLSPLRCSNSKLHYNGSRWLEGMASYAQLTPSGVLQLSAGSTFDGQYFVIEPSVEISPNGVNYSPRDSETVSASWANIINAANSGGGGEVPENMMTTDTVQIDLTSSKTWTWDNYSGGGTAEAPQDGDRWSSESFTINYLFDKHYPLSFRSNRQQYNSKEGWHDSGSSILRITSDEVHFNDSFASWSSIIKGAKVEQGFDNAHISQMEDGSIEINGVKVIPNKEIKIGDHVLFVIDSNSKIASVRANSSALDVSAAVIESSTAHRVSGIISNGAVLSFDSPVTPARGQQIYVHWTRYNNI